MPARASGSSPPPAEQVGSGDPGMAPYYGGSPGGGDENWQRYLSALLRRKWVLLMIVVLGSVAGIGAAMLVEPEYVSEVRLWVDQRDGGADGPFESAALLQSYDWVDLLRSYAVLESVVQDRALIVRPGSSRQADAFHEFRVEDRYDPGRYELRVDDAGEAYSLWADTVEVDSGALSDGPIGRPAGFLWEPPAEHLSAGSSIEFRLIASRDAARELGERMDVRMLDQGNFMHIALRDRDPEEGAATLNAVADRFVSLATQLRTGRTDELEERLANQLQTSEEQLVEAESALESFRSQNMTLPAADGSEMSPTQTNYFDRLYERDRVRRDLQALDDILDGTDDDPAVLPVLLEGIPITAESPRMRASLEELAAKRLELQALERNYTSEHPDVQVLAEEVRALQEQTIPGMARQLRNALAREEADLTSEVDARSAELAAIPSRSTESARLQRSAAIAGELYTTLRERHEATRLAAASNVPEIRVLDPAEPAQDAQDLQSRLILFAIVASLGLGVVGILLHDRFDPKVRYPEEISRDMGLTILGTIPHLKLKKVRKGPQVAEEATEAFRSLRLNLTYAFGAAGPLVTAVTSPAPGEGKSFVTMNLALRFARSGSRTLLVDADMRRGTLHRSMNLPRRPGLMDFLTGESPLDEIVHETAFEALDLVPSGVRMKNAPELLSASKLNEFVAVFKKEYDVILFDTPPLGVGVDPLVFSALTGNVLMVLRAGSTMRGFAETKLENLSRLPIRVLGAVFNDVPPGDSYPYYYSYFPDYETKEEATAQLLDA